MKRVILATIIVFTAIALNAQTVDSLYIDARGGFHQEGYGSEGDNRLELEYLNVQLWGKLTDNLTYRIRQRINNKMSGQDPFRSTDWLCLTWTPTPRLSLYAGKTAVLIGGYEYDSAPIDVYYYSQFVDNLRQYFAFSANASYQLFQNQSFAVQVSNSPLTVGSNDLYAYSAAWMGRFAPWWHTLWSVNFVDDEYHRSINYIALGNHCVCGGLAVDVDLVNRASFQQEHFLLSDYSIITKLIWSIGKWNLCTKFGWEVNSGRNRDASGLAYDTIIAPGTNYLYGGCGVEYFPLGNDRVRLHAVVFNDNSDLRNIVEVGMKWRLDLVRSK